MPKPRTSAAVTATYLYQDEESFEKPIASAIAACIKAFEEAAVKVDGAEARTRAAVDDLKGLKAFKDAVETRLHAKSFHDLPGVKRGGERLDGRLYQLTIGPWRGVFLVDIDGKKVIGLVFSKYPHLLEERLDEIAARYRAKGREDADDNSSSG